MAKISQLPELAEPTGDELVPVIDTAGRTARASLRRLAEAGVSRLVQTALDAVDRATQLVSSIVNDAPTGYAFSLLDDLGNAAGGMLNDGTWRARRVRTELVDADDVISLQLRVAGGTVGSAVPNGFTWALLDDLDNAAVGVRDSGVFVAGDIESKTLNGLPLSAYLNAGTSSSAGAVTARYYQSEHVLLISYGQSLSVGADGAPVSLVQRFDNIMVSGGIRTIEHAGYTTYVPLVERLNGVEGETPISGATEMIKELMLAEDQLRPADFRYQLIGVATGAGAQPIDSLKKKPAGENTFYPRNTTDIAGTFNLSQAAGRSFSVGALFFTQGESDYIANTPGATWEAEVIAMRTNVDADAKAVTGQADPVPMISYQTNANNIYGHANDPYLALVQLKVALENPHHYVACPIYQFAKHDVHLSGDDYKRMGAHYGLVYKRVVIDRVGWKPCYMVSGTRQGRIAVIRCHVPKGKLSVDTSIGARPDLGFSLVTSAGAPIAIASVEVIGPDRIKIVAAAAISAGAQVRYAFNDGGNIRDTQGETIVFNGGGLNYPVHNWLAICAVTLA